MGTLRQAADTWRRLHTCDASWLQHKGPRALTGGRRPTVPSKAANVPWSVLLSRSPSFKLSRSVSRELGRGFLTCRSYPTCSLFFRDQPYSEGFRGMGSLQLFLWHTPWGRIPTRSQKARPVQCCWLPAGAPGCSGLLSPLPSGHPRLCEWLVSYLARPWGRDS